MASLPAAGVKQRTYNERIGRLVAQGKSGLQIAELLIGEGYGAMQVEGMLRDVGFETLIVQPNEKLPICKLYVTMAPLCLVSRPSKAKKVLTIMEKDPPKTEPTDDFKGLVLLEDYQVVTALR